MFVTILGKLIIFFKVILFLIFIYYYLFTPLYEFENVKRLQIFPNLGWGTTEFAGSMADVLQEATVSVINLSKCQQTYNRIGNNQLCTYSQGKDACQVY